MWEPSGPRHRSPSARARLTEDRAPQQRCKRRVGACPRLSAGSFGSNFTSSALLTQRSVIVRSGAWYIPVPSSVSGLWCANQMVATTILLNP